MGITNSIKTVISTLLIVQAYLVYGKTYSECLQDVENGVCQRYSHITICTNDGVVHNGVCDYQRAICDAFYNRHISLTVTGTGANGVCNFTHHITSTSPRPLSSVETNLYRAIANGIDSRLLRTQSAGTEVSEAIKIFSKQDHVHKVYIRNSDCWAHDLDLTCISPWNSNGHNRKAGTLISPRHAIWARHYNMPINTTLRFVDLNNKVVERKIIKIHALPVPAHMNYHSGYDMMIGLLDQDVPSSITFAKVLPRNFTEIYGSHVNHVLPVLSTDYEEKALVDDLRMMHGKMVTLTVPNLSYRHAFYESKIVGDSGNPSFFVIDNQLVFLFVFTYGGAGAGTSVQFHYDDVNHVMKNLGGGYALTEIDLSSYANDLQITNIFG
ncbi:uncharacterized protein LOC133175284 [Saccostrea echinata]|uniref:uncharacterized protein LOC133175284 n=1 Tax=Saccostrea echinata TaxID=191078 RepID=UPI002A82ED36|nr:uncharacterized protein LOC133175284 [Saccostrea echinata]